MTAPNRTTIHISGVNVRVVEKGSDGLIGWASCIIDGAIRLNNIAIRLSRTGSLFLTYPNRISNSGDKFPHFNPISSEAAKSMEDAVLSRLTSLARAASTNTPPKGPQGR